MAGVTVTAINPYLGTGRRRLVRTFTNGVLWTVIGDTTGSPPTLRMFYSSDNGTTWHAGPTVTYGSTGIAYNFHLVCDKNDNIWLYYCHNGQGWLQCWTPDSTRTVLTSKLSLTPMVAAGSDPANNLELDFMVVPSPVANAYEVFVTTGQGTSTPNQTTFINHWRITNFNIAPTLTNVTASDAGSFGDGGWNGSSSAPTVAIDFEHTGDGKTPVSTTPRIFWACQIYHGASNPQIMAQQGVMDGTGKVTWGSLIGGAANSSSYMSNGMNNLDGKWDGSRWLVSYVDSSGGSFLHIFVHEFSGSPLGSVPIKRDMGATPGTTNAIVAHNIGFDQGTGNFYIKWRDNTSKAGILKWTRATTTTSDASSSFSDYATYMDSDGVFREGSDGVALDLVYIDSGWRFQRLALQAPPLAPTLTAPANASYQDLAAGFTFTWTYNPAVGGNTQTNYAMRRKISGAGSYEYWNAGTNAWQSTIVWNASASSSLTFGASLWTDGNIYNWSVATQDAGGQGPFAADFTVNASVPPAVTVTVPSGTTAANQPVVQWSDTLPSGQTQASYRIVVESGTYGSTPGSGAVAWDSGVVSSTSQSVQVAVPLANNTSYRFFVIITDAAAGQSSGWGFSTATVAFDAPAQPLLTATWDAANARTVLTVQGRDNILTLDESSFEASLGDWGTTVNAVIARTTAQFQDGVASMQMTASSAGDMSAQTATGLAARPVIGGKQYTAMASFKAAATARACMVIIQWYDATGTFISSSQSPTVNDGTSGWTQATITVNAPAGAAFAAAKVYVVAPANAEVHYVDEVDIGPGGATPWTAGGFTAGGETVIVEWSLDNVNWTAVRTSPGTYDSAADQQVTFYDYEKVAGQTVYYRARAAYGAGASFVVGPNSATQSVLPTMTSWWVKDVINPALNKALCDAQQNIRNRKGDSTAFYPARRPNPIVLRGTVHGADGTFRTVVQSEADRTAVLALFTALDSMLIQDPRGRQWYAEWVGDLTDSQFQDDQPHYAISRNWVEVDVPS